MPRTLTVLATAFAVLLGAVAWLRAGPADDPKLAAPALAGTIIDEQGQPVAGATIKLYSGIATRFLSQTRVTDFDGRYTFDPVVAGDGWMGDNISFGMVVEHPTLARADGLHWEEVEMERADRKTLDLRLVRAGAIEGIITDSAGHLARGLEVRLMTKKGQTLYATTGADGVFVLTGIAPGDWELQENGGGTDGYTELGHVRVTGGERMHMTITHPADLQARKHH
jgi:hypothetical protein